MDLHGLKETRGKPDAIHGDEEQQQMLREHAQTKEKDAMHTKIAAAAGKASKKYAN